MRLQFWAADTLRFSVTGPEPHRFLNRAAAAGVRLRRVRWQRGGYAATVSGADRRRLERIARDGGWTLAVTFGPSGVSIRPKYRHPLKGQPSACMAATVGRKISCMQRSATAGV